MEQLDIFAHTLTDFEQQEPPPIPPKELPFPIGAIVLVADLVERDRLAFVGIVQGYDQSGMVQIDVGIPGSISLYSCSEDRLTHYDGVVSQWRMKNAVICDRVDCSPRSENQPFTCALCGARSRHHWWYTGAMATEASQPRWPNAMWFPAGYDPNTKNYG